MKRNCKQELFQGERQHLSPHRIGRQTNQKILSVLGITFILGTCYLLETHNTILGIKPLRSGPWA